MNALYFELSRGVGLDMILDALSGHADGGAEGSFALSDFAERKTKETYDLLREAEAKAHGVSVEKVHLHEVGRIENVINALKIFSLIERLTERKQAQKIFASKLVDGVGKTRCSHGEIPVPVPAVRHLAEAAGLKIERDEEVETEMLTPMALATLIAMGTVFCEPEPREEDVISVSYGKGTRKIKDGRGLKCLRIKSR